MIQQRHTAPLRLQGQRVALRGWHPQDDRTQRGWPRYSEPCSQLWNIPRSSLSGTGLLFSYHSTSVRRVWALEDQQGALIGRISLREIEQRTGRARLGISLAADRVGHGMGSEALSLFLHYYFTEMKFMLMVLDVAAFNQRAVRCYERLGFEHTSNDWRKSTCRTCMQALEVPENQHMLPFFRRERYSLWVQFLEMELRRSRWYERCLQAGQLAGGR